MNISARWRIPWTAITVIVLATIMAGALGYIVSASLPKTYEARVQLVAGQVLDAVDPDYTQLLAWPLMAQMYAQLATAHPVLEAVIQDLGLSTSADELGGRVRAETSQESVLLTLEVDDGDREQAAAIANGIAEALESLGPTESQVTLERRRAIDTDLAAISAEVDRLVEASIAVNELPSLSPEGVAQLEQLHTRIADLRLERAAIWLQLNEEIPSSPVQIISRATPPSEATGPLPLLNAALASIVGLVLSALTLFFLGGIGRSLG